MRFCLSQYSYRQPAFGEVESSSCRHSSVAEAECGLIWRKERLVTSLETRLADEDEQAPGLERQVVTYSPWTVPLIGSPVVVECCRPACCTATASVTTRNPLRALPDDEQKFVLRSKQLHVEYQIIVRCR
jgi:hypothetical protein